MKFDFDNDGVISDDEKGLLSSTDLAGKQFLEAAPKGWYSSGTQDDPLAQWGGDAFNLPDVVDVAINLLDPEPDSIRDTVGNGQRNTGLILAFLSERTQETDTAAHLCTEYTGGGLQDWFLPSVGELVVLQSMMAEVGGIMIAGYNSSSESRFNNLRWVVVMREDSFGVDTIRKNKERRVRPIRAF